MYFLICGYQLLSQDNQATIHRNTEDKYRVRDWRWGTDRPPKEREIEQIIMNGWGIGGGDKGVNTRIDN